MRRQKQRLLRMSFGLHNHVYTHVGKRGGREREKEREVEGGRENSTQ